MSRRFSHNKRNPWRLPFDPVGSAGVYVITNKKTGRIYIGSSFCCPFRWAKHLSDAYLRIHHNKELSNDFRTFGSTAFRFEIVALIADQDKRLAEESRLIAEAKRKCTIPPYNVKD